MNLFNTMSDMLQYCIETAEYIIILSSAYSSPIILVFPELTTTKHLCVIPTESPTTGALSWGI